MENLTYRAPANSQYAETLLKLCRESGDTDTGLRYLDRLFNGEIPQPPPGLSFEEMYRAHAVFLRLTDVDRLTKLAYLHPLPDAKAEPLARPPVDIHYLRELLEHWQVEENGENAMRTLERLAAFCPEEDGLFVQFGGFLEKTGRVTEAAAFLREKLADARHDEGHKMQMRSQLFRLLLQGGERREALALLPAMTRDVDAYSYPVFQAANELARCQAPEEARTLLASARRRAKETMTKALFGARLLQVEIEMTQGHLETSLPTLNLLLRANAMEDASLHQLIRALRSLPAHQFPAWADYFQRQSQRAAPSSMAVLGFFLLTDHPEAMPALARTLLQHSPHRESAGRLLEAALETLLEAGQWEKSRVLLEAILPFRNSCREWLQPRLLYAEERHDSLMRQEELKSVEMSEDMTGFQSLLYMELESGLAPGFTANLARQMVEKTSPEQWRSTDVTECLQILLRAGDISAARKLLQEGFRFLEPQDAVQALLTVAEAGGRLAIFEQDLANYQPAAGISAAALRAWRRKQGI